MVQPYLLLIFLYYKVFVFNTRSAQDGDGSRYSFEVKEITRSKCLNFQKVTLTLSNTRTTGRLSVCFKQDAKQVIKPFVKFIPASLV